MSQENLTRKDPQDWRRLMRRTLGVLGVGIGLYLMLMIYSGFRPMLESIKQISNANLLLMVALVLLGWLIRAYRWQYFNRLLGWNVPAKDNLLIFLASFAFTVTPGKMGEVVKSGMLYERYQVSVAESAGVLIVERLQDLIAVLLIAAGGLNLLAQGWFYFSICCLLLGGLVGFIMIPSLYRGILTFFAQLHPRLKKPADGLINLFDTSRRLFRPRPFCVGLLLALIAWTGEALVMYLICHSLNLYAPAGLAFSAYGLATLVGALSMLPGGIGGFEAVMLIFLTQSCQATKIQATAATILIRGVTLWMVSLAGMAFFAFWLICAKRRGQPSQP